MNNSVFNTTGGYPLTTERLQELQTSFTPFNAFGGLAGNLTIVEGCEVAGSNVSAGFVYINGELLEFRAGYQSPGIRVIIVEEPVNREFQNGETHTVYKVRYATFGVADESWLWADFKRPIQTKEIPTDLNEILQTLMVFAAPFLSGGTSVFWNRPANEIPNGWEEDTSWRGRFAVGVDPTQTEFNVLGKQGGAKSKTLTIAEMPEHNHGVEVHGSDDGNGYGRIQGGSPESVGINNVDVQNKGGGQAFSILNPYRTVYFIKMITT